MNKSEIFRAAHQTAKSIRAQFTSYRAAFAAALKNAYNATSFVVNSTVEAMSKKLTKITELNQNTIVLALAVMGWNFKVYGGNVIYIKKEKIALTDAELEAMRSGIAAYNEGKPAYKMISF